ncbi:uncharacterized protein F4812DRAFT_436293 [Daldinia caldariorum]|uniref:uncharacterized protein n=1 Tax=Daldinia caldariorum TaxID=326644 RepID=UPI0020077B3D|nr:uncharacterized protein F4812DRAFT_436293 [Daldinia caldariorum]KAI1466209.1 hypothetical protein F4812DRAFT_436293 [Daldinia caldariorum]
MQYTKSNMEPGKPHAPWEPLPNWYDTKLEDILPRDGFVFPDGYKIFNVKQDWVRVKWAIEAPAPTLEEHKVDAVLAAIMDDANIIAGAFRQNRLIFNDNNNRSCLSTDEILESACKEHDWTEIVPDGRFPHLLKTLIRARKFYNQITHIRGRSEAEKDKQQGKLATAIDVWTKTHPVDDPDPRYARMTADLKESMINRLIEGKGVKRARDDESTDTEKEADNKPDDRGPDKCTNHKRSKKSEKEPQKKVRKVSRKAFHKDLSDEDCPWVHTNYSSTPQRTPAAPMSTEEEDDESAPWVRWSQTRRARQLLRTPATEKHLMLYRT